MASKHVEKVLQGTMEILDKVRSSDKGFVNVQLGDEEDVSLTTGKQVPQRRSLWIAVAVLAALAVAGAAVVAGVILGRKSGPDVIKAATIVPFVSMPDPPLSFLVVGDWGRNGQYNQTLNAQGMAKVANALQPNFVISTGDNFYMNGLLSTTDPQFDTSFKNVYSGKSLTAQWYAVLGNHDYHVISESELDPALKERDSRWHCERNYRRKFDACAKCHLGPCKYSVEFFFVDTSPLLEQYYVDAREELNFTLLPPRNQAIIYIVNLLRDGLESSDATWKIVVGHHPVYSTGVHGMTAELELYFTQWFKKYKVDLYINGHDHNLELTKKPDKDTFFVTSGAGSQTRSERSAEDAASLFYHDRQGFVAASVSELHLDLRFYNAHAALLYNLTLGKESS